MSNAISDRWFLGSDALTRMTFVASAVRSGILRVYEETWDHTCLDIDSSRRIVTERDQRSSPTDDPDEWSFEVRSISFADGECSVLLKDEDLSAWVEAWTAALQHWRDFGDRFPIHARVAAENAASAARLLDTVQGFRPTWTPLFSGIQTLIANRGAQ